MYKASDLPGEIIGYRKNGAPIRLIAGGDPTHDDDPELNPPPDPPAGRTFTEEEVNRLLSRERDKLHGRLSKTDERAQAMEAELKELTEDRKRREREDAKRQKDAEAAAKKAQEAEMSAKELIDRRQAEWEQQRADLESQWTGQIGTLQQQIAERDALWAREQEFQKLAAYARNQVEAARDEIAPQFFDYITGGTTEEIDASIATAKAKTAEIKAEVTQARTGQRASLPGVSAAGFTAAGPLEMQGGTRQLSLDEIKALSGDEYAKLRMQPGMPGAVGNNNRGLFG